MWFNVIQSALGGMSGRPRRLIKALEFAAEQHDVSAFNADELLTHLMGANPTDDSLSALRKQLALWDNDDTDWTGGTPRNSEARRKVIYRDLNLDDRWKELCENRLPFHPLEEATVIAVKNKPWYSAQVRSANSFYWNAYKRQLERNGWDQASILQLDQNTNRIVEKLADPTAPAAYQSKGLVVGYVQSGKTANFTGLIAKAADAGYRLIIVMAGVLDVLRSQTQRRLDKELIGRELLQDEYQTDPDYNEFVSHGKRPSELSSFDIYRLTGPDHDYKSLAYGKEALKFDRKDADQPFWASNNLYPATARIAVVKKNPAILQKLIADLRALAREKIGAPLDQVPVLIIDDESDQASINTSAPSPQGEVLERTQTNKAIVNLLNQLPRSQYVGFTATPSANALVDPASAEDIFPKDFLISLPKPVGYMGASDFYDFEVSEDGRPGPNQRDFVRSVTDEDDKPSNLLQAIDSYILAGAIKLYRNSMDSSLKFKHHTMLVHLTQLQVDHKAFAKEIVRTIARAGYEGGNGLSRLDKLLESDFRPIHAARGQELPFPKNFKTLLPFVGDCIQRIGEPAQAVRILNTEHKDQSPDFDRERIWKILVGGAKLSRGYTVDGLTISYYRRRTGAADTLMQMGRWFGFRRGYADLVRLFIGTNEVDGGPKSKKRINLYEAFGSICRDEEAFRKELVRYAEDPDIIPAAIPPLVPSHMLRPTAQNKMRNARITFRNYGGELSESTFAPLEVKTKDNNIRSLRDLVDKSQPRTLTATGLQSLTTNMQKKTGQLEGRRSFNGVIFEVSPEKMIDFLKAYKWQDENTSDTKIGNPLRLQLEFLQGSAGSPGIERWLVISPKISSPTSTFPVNGTNLDVVYRSRQSGSDNRFNTYNDPRHRAFAQHLAGSCLLDQPSEALEAERKPQTAVMLLYLITEAKSGPPEKHPTVGFTLLFPNNKILNAVGYTVLAPGLPFDAVVQIDNDGAVVAQDEQVIAINKSSDS